MIGYDNLSVDYGSPPPIITEVERHRVALLCASLARGSDDLAYLLRTFGIMPYDYSRPLLPP